MRVIAFMVTAVKDDFRRVGRSFKRGVPTRVEVDSITAAQAEYLAASRPKELKVEPIFDEPPAEAPAKGRSK